MKMGMVVLCFPAQFIGLIVSTNEENSYWAVVITPTHSKKVAAPFSQ